MESSPIIESSAFHGFNSPSLGKIRRLIFKFAVERHPRVLATQYIKGQGQRNREIKPVFDQNILNFMLVSREALSVVRENFQTYHAVVVHMQPGNNIQLRSIAIHLDPMADTLLVNTFEQHHRYSVLYATLDREVRVLLARHTDLNVAFCWHSFLFALWDLPSKRAKVDLFNRIMHRSHLTAVVYDEIVPMTPFYIEIDEIDLFGPTDEDVMTLVDIEDTKKVYHFSGYYDEDGVEERSRLDKYNTDEGVYNGHGHFGDRGTMRAAKDACTARRHIQAEWLEANGCFDPVAGSCPVQFRRGVERRGFPGHDSEPWELKQWDHNSLCAQTLISELPPICVAISLTRRKERQQNH